MRSNREGSRSGGLRRDFELHQLQPRLGFFASSPESLPYDYEDVLELIAGGAEPKDVLVYTPVYDRVNDHAEVAACVGRARTKLQGRGSSIVLMQPKAVNMLDQAAHDAVLSWLANVTAKPTGGSGSSNQLINAPDVAEAAATDPPAAGSWVTINVFHINPASYGAAPVDMNTGDALGDMYFDLRTKAISIECAPPIPPGNVHTCANGEVSIGLGRIVALYYRSSTLYQIH
jgi:hypothetical protein